MVNPNCPDYSNTPASKMRAGPVFLAANPCAQPVVSIITPFFNTGEIFYETAQSVFRQTFQQWEWIIINDGSTDVAALKILEEFRRKDPRIRVVNHSANKGLSAARNTGFEEARSEFVFQLDADDLIEPTTLEKMAWHLQTQPGRAFVTGYTVGFGSKEYLWRRGFHDGTAFIHENLVTATCLVRKSVHKAVGGYEAENRGGMEDWEFWLKCASRGYWGGTIREFLDWYRRRDTGREHWDNLCQTDKSEKFRARLKERYPELWRGKFPKIEANPSNGLSSASEALPFENRLVKQKPRLLLIVPHYEMGGADKFNLDLIRQLQVLRGYEITVAATRVSANPWLHEFEALTSDVFALDHFLEVGDFPLFLRYLITSRQPDVVCLSNCLMGYQLLPYLRAHFPGLPFVDYLHMEEEDYMAGGYPRHSVEQRSQIARTGTTSQHLKNWVVQRGGDEAAIEVCPCNIDVNKWRKDRFDTAALAKKWKIDQAKPVILYAGRICPQKQPRVFAEVIRRVVAKNPKFTALVAGDGPDLPWLKDFAARENLSQVRFLGAVANDEMPELLAVSDIFFLPSRWEGIALTIYEAMAMSVVPLGAAVGGQAELVLPECGILVQRGRNEADDYAAALLKLLSSPADRTRMAQAARARVEQHFPIEKMGRQMDEIFQKAKCAAAKQRGRGIFPIDLANLYAAQVVEQTRAANCADLIYLEQQKLTEFVKHTVHWQGCLRAGRVLADANQRKLALDQFEEGLRFAVASELPPVELGARVEIAKAILPLDFQRCRAVLQGAADLAERLGEFDTREQISRTLAGLKAPAEKKKASAPLVSVVIPCYKQAHFLPEAVESVISQSFRDWEIIIVNDGSPDNTSDIAKQLIARHSGRRIRLVEQANGGLPSARNAGMRAAQGRYLLPLDADDKIKPALLEKLVPILDNNPKVGFAYGHIQHFGHLETEFPLPDFDRETMVTKDNIGCVCSLIRRTAWEKVGGYNESMREGYEDWDFWIGCVEQGFDGFCLHEPLFLYRKHGSTMLSDANQKRERLMARIVQNHPKLYSQDTQKRAQDVLAKPEQQKPIAQSGRPKLRITYLIGSILGVTGGNQTLLRQAEEMQRRGHEVTIVTYTPKPDWFQFRSRVIQVPEDKPLGPSVPPSDIVVATYFVNAHELKTIQAPVKVYYAQGDQFIFDDTGMADTPQNRQLRELSRGSYQLPGIRFVPNSRNLANAARKLCGRVPDAVLPVCTDQTIFRPLQRSVPGSKLRILVVGPDIRGTASEPLLFKGIQDIHDALQIVARKYPHFTTVRMSNTPPEIFARTPCEFYIAPDDEAKTALFGGAHILIYASHYDSCPRPPQEAMAAGCAVICTATEGAMEYCRDGENCLLVPIKCPEAIASAVERLIRDHALREKLAQGGLATAREFPREREWNEWESILYKFMEEAMAPTKSVKQTSQVALPECALIGDLRQAREFQKKKDLKGAWEAVCAALEKRPFHPEAVILAGQVAQTAGDFAVARRCGQCAAAWTPNWKPAKQFLKSIPAGNSKSARFELPAFLDSKSGTSLRLTVCLIAKNEEKFLERCLKSIREIAHQIIVVDTGSTDRTVEIAKKFNAEVYSFAWNDDFSAARNEALRHATGDWILSLDADEELLSEHRKTIVEEMRSNKVMAYRLPIIDVGREDEGSSYVPRLFRNAPGLYFIGRVHEEIFSSVELKAREWDLENRLGRSVLLHHGYTKEVITARGKVERNLRLLKLAVEERPDQAHLVMSLGLELIHAGQMEAGLAQYREALRLVAAIPPNRVMPEVREALLTQLTTHLLDAKRFAEIIELWRQPYPTSVAMTASQHFMLGLAHMELKQPVEAAGQMRQCLAKRAEPVLTPIHKNILKAGPAHCLALCLASLGQKSEAEKAFQKALSDEPKSRAVRMDWAKFQWENGKPLESLRIAGELVGEDGTDVNAWRLGGLIALSDPQYISFAREWTGEAVKYFSTDNGILEQRAEAMLMTGDIDAALSFWSQAGAEKSARGLAGIILCEVILDKTPRKLAPESQRVVSHEFLRWYRHLIKFKVNAVIARVNEKLEDFGAILPPVQQVLGAALKKADEALAV